MKFSKGHLLFWCFFVGFVILDQAVKAWIRHAIPVNGSIPLPWPGVFELTLTYNEGIAFGKLQGFGVWLAPVAVAIAGGATWYSMKHPEESKWGHVAFGLLAAGAVGNLVDRVWDTKVTDMFNFRLINFPIFNVADACITISTIMLVIVWWRDAIRHGAAEGPKVETSTVEPE